MKKKLMFLLVFCSLGAATASPSIRYIQPMPHYDFVARQMASGANKKADVAKSIAIMAVFVAALGIFATINFSENNPGQVTFIRF